MVLKSRRRFKCALLPALVLAMSCSTDRSADELFAPGGVGVPVVDAMLVVGRPFPDVYVTRSLSPGESFSLDRAAILGATVTIDGGGTTLVYLTGNDSPGQYSAPITGASIQPSTVYNLTVNLPDGGTLRATTRTPSPIQVLEWVLLDDSGTQVVQRMSTFAEDADSVYFQPENQLVYPDGLVEIRLAASPATGYQIGLASLDLGSQLLIDADFLDEQDLENFTRTNGSPPLDAQNVLRIPWFAIYFEGRYKMRVFAMDRNWYDLARTDPVLGSGGIGFGGEAGDGFNRPIFHVEGGIGLFGSMSVDSVGFYVHPPAP